MVILSKSLVSGPENDCSTSVIFLHNYDFQTRAKCFGMGLGDDKSSLAKIMARCLFILSSAYDTFPTLSLLKHSRLNWLLSSYMFQNPLGLLSDSQ